MNRGLSGILAPLIAVGLFAFIGWQTLGALHVAGAWVQPNAPEPLASDGPFAQLDGLLAAAEHPARATALDPFVFGGAVAAVTPVTSKPVVKKPVIPPPPPRPVLTAIVWAAEPSAVVHWKDHDWTLHPGALFDEFQVLSISRDQVVLKRGDENIVLTPRKN